MWCVCAGVSVDVRACVVCVRAREYVACARGVCACARVWVCVNGYVCVRAPGGVCA